MICRIVLAMNFPFAKGISIPIAVDYTKPKPPKPRSTWPCTTPIRGESFVRLDVRKIGLVITDIGG
jgi:hypothetical protein